MALVQTLKWSVGPSTARTTDSAGGISRRSPDFRQCAAVAEPCAERLAQCPGHGEERQQRHRSRQMLAIQAAASHTRDDAMKENRWKKECRAAINEPLGETCSLEPHGSVRSRIEK